MRTHGEGGRLCCCVGLRIRVRDLPSAPPRDSQEAGAEKAAP